MAKPITHEDLVRKSRGITSAHKQGAQHERGITDLKTELRKAVADIEQMQAMVSHVPGHERGLKRLSAKVRTLDTGLNELLRREVGTQDPSPALTAAWQTEFERLQKEVRDYFTDLNTQLEGIRTAHTALSDRVGVLANDRVFGIDFDRSTHVPVTGQITTTTPWGLALLVGAVAGFVTGVLASYFLYEVDSLDWSFSKSVFSGIVIGVVVTLLWASFERHTFTGDGWITWAQRPTMEEEADQMARQNAGSQLPPPPPPPAANRTQVHPAVQQDARA